LSSAGKKLLLASLDGATFDVLGPLMRQGCMPNLAELLKNGVSAELESVIPPVTAPAWVSFMTGKHPGKHGIFEFSQFEPQTYSWRLNNAQHIRSKTLWDLLSEKGKRSVVLHLPYNYPPSPVNGVIVAGWDAPSVETNFTYPPAIREEIFRLIPDYASSHDVWLWKYQATGSDAQFQAFLDKQTLGVEHGVQLAAHLLATQSWDAFMVHFQQTDWVQHKLWHLIEEACTDPKNKSFRVEALRNWYRKLDQQVGRLVKEAARFEPSTIILSDHGFGRDYGNACVNYHLKQWGFLAVRPQASSPLRDFFRESRFELLRSLYRTLAQFKHQHFERRKYKSYAEFMNFSVTHQQSPVDWQKTKAALVTGCETGLVFVNVKGRGPFGIVEPGEEYDQLVSELIARLSELRHPRTGEKLIERAVRGAELYPGAPEDVPLPDIVLIGPPGHGFSTTLSNSPLESGPEGCHRPQGILILHGKGWRRPPVEFRPNLIDLAPTALHCLGVPVPREMDGRVLEEAFAEPLPVQYEEADTSAMRDQSAAYSARETKLIEERLRGLGYIE
jgi:predicted AlkP superfamily phosphohydrolase/phosphomutase